MSLFGNDNSAGLHAFRASHQAQYGVTIAYIKDKVGLGTEYANEVARAVLSEEGGYFQLTELPEEFVGGLGEGISHRLIAAPKAWEMLHQLDSLIQAVTKGKRGIRAMSLYALYPGSDLRTRQQMFVFDQQPGQPLFTHGLWQPEVLPRFVKLKLDTGPDAVLPKELGLRNGVLFFLPPGQRDDGRCLLATFARTAETQDLSAMPILTTRN